MSEPDREVLRFVLGLPPRRAALLLSVHSVLNEGDAMTATLPLLDEEFHLCQPLHVAAARRAVEIRLRLQRACDPATFAALHDPLADLRFERLVPLVRALFPDVPAGAEERSSWLPSRDSERRPWSSAEQQRRQRLLQVFLAGLPLPALQSVLACASPAFLGRLERLRAEPGRPAPWLEQMWANLEVMCSHLLGQGFVDLEGMCCLGTGPQRDWPLVCRGLEEFLDPPIERYWLLVSFRSWNHGPLEWSPWDPARIALLLAMPPAFGLN